MDVTFPPLATLDRALAVALFLVPALPTAAVPQASAGEGLPRAGAACSEHGSGPERAAVDSVFAAWDDDHGPGAAVAVLHEGEIVLETGYGMAQLEYGVPIGPCTVFHVASVTKQFVAFGAALLAEEGALSLDDEVGAHLSWLPDFGERITLRHLIHHTSGLRDQWQLLALGGWRLDDVITQEQVLDAVSRQRELNFPPGSRHLYSNTGYTLLAEVVEATAGKPFPAWMDERIFRPLGMERTHLHVDHEHLVPDRAYSYRRPDSTAAWRKSVLSYATAGATSLFTTAGDLARWMLNLETGEVGGPPVLARMHERGVLDDGDTLDYAFGIARGEHRGRVTWGHSGGDAGFRSHVLRLPEERLAVAVVANAASLRPGRLARQVADVYLDVPAAPARRAEGEQEERPRRGEDLPGSVLEELAGRYDVDGIGVLEIRRADGHLAVDAGGPAVVLVPASDSLFRAEDRQLEVTFRRGPEGRVTGLRVVTPSGERSGRRLPDGDPAREELEAYEGDYLSRELRTLYRARVPRRDPARLVLSHPKHGDVPLEPAGEDVFTSDRWFLPKVTFTRDDAGDVDGFRVDGGRVLGLRFERRRLTRATGRPAERRSSSRPTPDPPR